ncbi:rhodanese-like domain-containing protein [Streptomyces sp. NBC_00582]|uniref:rhodanese-like domain-containing protein n=1 Tax=Streptomyces sp. NBC_00582 TaxID=2975783 RepID=UPI002E818EAD|nr:rhodanese-like domain-containing protein [Streptomyces sp. NBC_00582]WUB60655.1 rhodanese-like domain-containing protein [Streptomyces sp. NBC_00582]
MNGSQTAPLPPTSLTTAEAAARPDGFTVVDVRTPGEYASGRLPGALNVPLDRLGEASAALTAAARRRPLLIVCASGARSARGCARLADLGVAAATLEGGTGAWAAAGHPLERGAGARTPWPMDRQVRLAAGSLVVAGFLAGLAWPPAHWLSGLIGAGLVFSGATNTCGMAALLARLPLNRPGSDAVPFEETLARLAG